MSRRNRSLAKEGIYHITQQCHNKQFLLKFAKYRDIYVRKLYEMSKRYPVSVLDYIVTSNHVHLLLYAKKGLELSAALQFLGGQFAREYNYHREREGAFWSKRFYSTLIQSGEYFGRCLFYIDLNMVRAGAVRHPSEWKHCAYHEFMGEKHYKFIIDFQKLLKVLYINDMEQFRSWYSKTLSNKLSSTSLERESYWSKALMVGDRQWIEKMNSHKKTFRIYQDTENCPSYLFHGKIDNI